MSLENLFYDTLSQKSSSISNYDCVILFSGGKDSTYLAHLIKKAKAERICLFFIDNSFEDGKYVKEIAAKLNIDLYVYKPKEEEIIAFYNFLLSEPILKEIDSNPLCILCNRYFTALGIEFAYKFDIPFIVSAVTATQIFGSRVSLSIRLLNIAEKVLKAKYESTYNILKTTKMYKQDSLLRQVIDRMYILPDNVTIINPFLYFDYDIEKIKKVLENEYGWGNPDPNLPNEKYVSSGCKLTELFGIFERRLGFRIHEFEQYKLDYEKGALSLKSFNYGIDSLNKLLNKEVTVEMREMIIKLRLDDKLLE